MAVEEVTAHRPDLRYEELAEFIYGLRRSGLRAGPHQYTSAHRLLLALAAHEPIQNNPRRLATYLAPVLCSSPTEQEDFYRLFDQWLSQRLPPEPENQFGGARPLEPGTEPPEAERDPTPRWLAWLRSPQSRRVLLITLAAAAVAAAIIYLAFRYRPYALSGKVLEEGSGIPVANAEVSFAGQRQQTDETGSFSFTYKSFEATPTLSVIHDRYLPADPIPVGSGRFQDVTFRLTPLPDVVEPPWPPPTETPTPSPSPSSSPQTSPTVPPSPPATPTPTPTTQAMGFDALRYLIILAAVVASLFLAYGLWRLWRVFRLKQLERWRAENQPELLNLNVKGAGDRLYRSAAFRRLAQELRRHRRLKSNSLDVAQTVAATADEGGLFTPVYGSRLLTPEYLVLVDRQGFGDQQARLEDEIVARLRREGVFVDHYYFNADPRVCQAKGLRPVYHTLTELATRYPDHRLLVFSDGSGLIDPLSGRPHQWLEQFSPWPVRVLLTPAPDWGYREWLLEQAGWAVRPAREQGLLTLMEITRAGEVSKAPQRPPRLSDYPELLLSHPERWLEERAPDGETLEELRVQLRYYLGSEGYYLLSACAVYPQLLWGITFYFAHHLVGEKRQEETLEALVRLPWLRHGFMPDWLRTMLIANLPPTREADIRQALEKLLVSHLENPHDGFGIDIAPKPVEPKESYWAGQWERLKRKARELKGKKFLHDLIRTEPEGGPLRDYVFLNFMSASKLAVLLPRTLRRLLYRRGQPILGLHPVRGLLIPAALAVLAAITLAVVTPRTSADSDFPLTPELFDELASVLTPVGLQEDKPSVLSTPTPSLTPSGCRDDLTAADGYVIRELTVRVDNGPANSFASFRRRPYSPADSSSVARRLARGIILTYPVMRDITSIRNCPRVIEPATCQTELGAPKCLDLQVTVGTENRTDAEMVSLVPPPPAVVTEPTTLLIIISEDPATTSLVISVLNEKGEASKSTVKPTLSRLSRRIPLSPGRNDITVFDPQRRNDPRYRATASVRYETAPGEGTLKIMLVDPLVFPIDGRVKVARADGSEPNAPWLTYSAKDTSLYVKKPPGRYIVYVEADGYSPTGPPSTVEVRAGEETQVVPTLRRNIPFTPTPTPSPGPTPESALTINSVVISFSTTADAKESTGTVTTQIMLGKDTVGSSQFGTGQNWLEGSTNVRTIELQRPVPLAQCNQMSIRVNKASQGEDVWVVRINVSGRLSDGSSVVLLSTSDITISDPSLPDGFSHPLSCIGSPRTR